MSVWRDIVKDPHFVESGVRKLVSDFQTQHVISNTLRTLLRIGKITDDTIVDAIDSQILATAVGLQLDFLGALVGEPRLGRDHEEYREAIRLRVRANANQATVADLFALMTLAVAAPWSFFEIPYGAYRVQIAALPAVLHRALGDVLARSRPLGHQGELTYTPSFRSHTIRFANAGAPGVRFFNTGQPGTRTRLAHARRL